MVMDDGSIRVCDFGASAAIDPRTGRVAAMPIEINELEQQFGSLDGNQVHGDTSSGQNEVCPAMTPYTLRKVTQVLCLHVRRTKWTLIAQDVQL